MNKNQFFISVLVITTYWTINKAEKIYSLVTDLQPLLETQRNMIKEFETIIERDKKVLKFVETEIERYLFEYEKVKKNTSSSLEELLIKFKITKRLSVDLIFLEHTLRERMEFKRDECLTYPTAEDLQEAVNVLSRLQRFYRLNVTQLADGLLNTTYSEDGKIYTEVFLPMTSSDCYVLGKLMFSTSKNNKSYTQGLQWLLEAIRLYDKAATDDCAKVDIIRYICESYRVLGEHNKYVEWVEKIISLKPNDGVPELELKESKNQLLQTKSQNKKRKKKMFKINPVKELENCLKGLDRKTYRMLCRGEIQIPPSVSKRLKCWYDNGHHPFSKLARFRAEHLYKDPNIYLYHDIISDTSIENLKQLAGPVLKPLITVNGPSMMTSMVYQRTKGAELNASQSEQISQRISDFTGLNTASSQFLVNNYGVGGYYVGHVDGPGIPDRNRIKRQLNLTDSDSDKIEKLLEFLRTCHKIASVIVYLSEVEQGGATVFPVLGISQYPVKGAALFWHNLLPSGDMDYATCHGVCPVLRGSRWVASQFIDSESQVLHQSCKMKTTYFYRRMEEIPHPVIKDKNVNS